MKKLLLSLFALVATVATASAEREQVELDVMSDYTAYSSDDQYFEFQNEDYYLTINLKEVPQVGKTYTMDDVIADYTFVRSKNEIFRNQYGTPEWKKYMITSLNISFTVVNVRNRMFKFTAQVDAANGNDVLQADFKYDAPEKISVTLDGECEYLADLDLYAFSARNKGSEVKKDYAISLGIKGSAWTSGNFVTSDLYVRGNEITVAAREDVKITGIDLTLEKKGDKQLLKGEVTDANGQVYDVNITTNTIGQEEGTVEVDLGSVLKVSEDEGDIKLKAQTSEHEFVGYITCTTTNVPSGTYELLSYSKYGDWNADFGIYLSDSFQEGMVEVVNTAGDITITATFKQGGKAYKVTASTVTAGIKNVSDVTAGSVKKYVEDGKLIILKGGKKYGVEGVLK